MTQDVYGTSGNRQSDQSTGAKAREQGQHVAQDAKQQAGVVASSAREEAKHVADEVRNHAQEMMHEARGQVRQQAEQQTGNVGQALTHLGDQFRALGEGRPEDAGPVGDYANRVADVVQQMGNRLSERGFDGSMQELQRYARRRPGAFLMGAAAAGFAASRMARGVRDASQSSGSTTSAPRGTTSAPARPVSEATLPPPPVTSPEHAGQPVPPAPDQAAPSIPGSAASDTGTATTGRMQR